MYKITLILGLALFSADFQILGGKWLTGLVFLCYSVVLWGKVLDSGVKTMFGGVTHLNLDAKNRLVVPARHRETLYEKSAGRVVITLESAQCLLIYSENEWFQVREKVQNLPNSVHPLVKSYQRLILGYAESLEVDKAGRILIPAALKKMANLQHELVLVGMGNRFELWDKENWRLETEKALQSSAEDLATLLNGFSL